MRETVSSKSFGRRLRRLRRLRGLSQLRLGLSAGVDGQVVSHIESGRNLPSLPTAWALADGLKISLDYLVGRSDNQGRVYVREIVRQVVESLPKEADSSSLERPGSIQEVAPVPLDQDTILMPSAVWEVPSR